MKIFGNLSYIEKISFRPPAQKPDRPNREAYISQTASGIKKYLADAGEAFSLIWPRFRASALGKGDRYKYTLPLMIGGTAALGILFPGQVFGLMGMWVTGIAHSMKDLRHVRPVTTASSLLFCADMILKGPGGWAGALLSAATAVRTSLIGMTPDHGPARKWTVAGISAAALGTFAGMVMLLPGFSLNFLNAIPLVGIATGLLVDAQKSDNTDASRFYRFIGQAPNLAYHALGSRSLGASATAFITVMTVGLSMYKYDYGAIKEKHPDKTGMEHLGLYLAHVLKKTPAKFFFPRQDAPVQKPDSLGREEQEGSLLSGPEIPDSHPNPRGVMPDLTEEAGRAFTEKEEKPNDPPEPPAPPQKPSNRDGPAP